MAYSHLYKKANKLCFLHGKIGIPGGYRYWFSFVEADAIDVPEGYEVVERLDGWPQIRKKSEPFRGF